MFTLRPYQLEAVEGIFEFFRTHPEGNPVVALPPGAGKTIVITEFIRRAICQYPKTRILNVVHVKELIEQSFKKLLSLWPTAPVGIYSFGLKRKDTHLPIIFSGVASIINNIESFPPFDLVLIDEADMVSHKESTMYRKLLNHIAAVNPNVRIIGFTGTAFRAGLGALTDGGVFTHVSTDYCSFEKFNSLVDNGYLCPLIPKRTDLALDVTGVHIQGGEFVQTELQDAVNKDSITRKAIAETLVYAHNRNRWLVFTTGISHADNTCAILNEMGVNAACVHSENGKDRDKNIADFRAGKLRALVGVGVFGVGFDCPEVDTIVMLRPTCSARIWIQYLGRGLRPHPSKKDTLVLDFARNTARLGCVNDVVIPKKPGIKKAGMVPFKICEACGTYAHTRARFCPDCQQEFPIATTIVAKASVKELIRRTPKEPKPPKPELPAEISTHNVDRVEFSKHISRDTSKAPSLKVTFYCGFSIFSQWLCLEHQHGFPKKKAHEAWRLMAGYEDDVPKTVDEALELVGVLRLPSQIRVMKNGKWEEVCGYEFGNKAVATEINVDEIPF